MDSSGVFEAYGLAGGEGDLALACRVLSSIEVDCEDAEELTARLLHLQRICHKWIGILSFDDKNIKERSGWFMLGTAIAIKLQDHLGSD